MNITIGKKKFQKLNEEEVGKIEGGMFEGKKVDRITLGRGHVGYGIDITPSLGERISERFRRKQSRK